MNSLFQQLNQQLLGGRSAPQNNIVNLFQKVKMMADPIGYINNIPEMKNVIGLVNQGGGNAKDVFYKLAEQKGVDPNTILNMFK